MFDDFSRKKCLDNAGAARGNTGTPEPRPGTSTSSTDAVCEQSLLAETKQGQEGPKCGRGRPKRVQEHGEPVLNAPPEQKKSRLGEKVGRRGRRPKENDQKEVCVICKTSEKYDISEVWAGCQICKQWAHTYCLAPTRPEFRRVATLSDIENISYICDDCKTKRKD